MIFSLRSNKKYPQALLIAKTLFQAGHRVLFAGGCVRDSLLGNPSEDIDIATSATPEMIQALFPKTVAVGAQFGVIMVISQGSPFEVATFRQDQGYSDGRRPNAVLFSDEKEDALRRDFTVNGLFYDPFRDEILDYVEGQKDLSLGIIRTIGRPQDRFREDKLRLLRAIRFSAKLGFIIEKETLNAIKRMSSQLSQISRERIRDEIFKIFQLEKILPSLKLIKETNLWASIFPFEPKEENLCFLASLPRQLLPELKLLALCWDNAGALIPILSDDFRLSRRQSIYLDNLNFFLTHFNELPTWRLALILRALRREPVAQILTFLDAWQKFFLPEEKELLNFIQSTYKTHQGKLSVPGLISGQDLIDMGLSPSAHFKEILFEAENLELEGTLKTRAEALRWLTQIRGKYDSEI